VISPKSFLFVPGDSERKMAKAEASAADAIVLDLEDSVSADRLPEARTIVRQYLDAHRDRTRQQVWVRINPIDTDKALDDLAAVVGGAPDGLLLPKTESGADVTLLDHYLTALERREGVVGGSIKVIAVATETTGSMFELGTYRNASSRLYGLTWGAEDLATSVGASTNRADDASYTLTFQMARTLCLLGSKAAGVKAIDGILANFRDSEGLDKEAVRSRKDGFNAKFAIHPDQVAIINTRFAPDAREIERARAIVAAFEAAGGAGTVQLDGVMLDKPHLTRALQILEAADPSAGDGK
jgi:citrate lyase subunit beta/citryl-CoA lyase